MVLMVTCIAIYASYVEGCQCGFVIVLFIVSIVDNSRGESV